MLTRMVRIQSKYLTIMHNMPIYHIQENYYCLTFNSSLMLVFCPSCGTLLTLEDGKDYCKQFSCRSCTYVLPIAGKLSSRIYPKKKEDEKILGGTEMWSNAQITNERCPTCSHDKAYFQQIQTRSADEPMTIFYRCANTNCAHRWKE